MDLYSKIQEENRKKYGTDYERVLNVIINQYSDRTHFIYEILQNAEDALASYIRFELYKNRLEIYHNGRPFDEADIQGVCGIADGTKNDGTRIGHFGIGFKSVYCYTYKPTIISGKYKFNIVNQLFPEETNIDRDVLKDETCMILPFDKEDVIPDVAYDEIKNALKNKITAESILMLNNILNVKISIEGDPDIIEHDKQKYSLQGDNVYSLSMHSTITNNFKKNPITKDSDYLYFTDAESDATAIIFKVDGKELKPVKHSKIYAFFPTAKEAHQKFYIHAPFDTTPARDNFKEGADYGKHNIQLVDRLGDLIWFAFIWMRDNGYLSAKGINDVFPIYEYEQGDIFYNLYEKAIDIMREEYIIPTNNKGDFKRIKDISIPSRESMIDVIDDVDLKKLTGLKNTCWISKEFISEGFKDIRTFIYDNYDVIKYEWRDLVLKFDSKYLSEKSLSWTEKLFSNIENICTNGRSMSSKAIDITNIPFVRTAKGENICARKNNVLQVYMNNPDIAKYRIDSEFLKSNIVVRFYTNTLMIPKYDINQEIIERILPKYEKEHVLFKTDNIIKENIEDLRNINKAVFSNPYIVEELQNKYIVTDGKRWYRPSELYIPSSNKKLGYGLVRGIKELKFMANSYFDDTVLGVKPDEDFYRKIGCNYGLKLMELSSNEYINLIRQYIGTAEAKILNHNIFLKNYTSSKIEWNTYFDGFPDVFNDISFDKSIEIVKFLNASLNRFDISGEIVGADDKNFAGKNVETAEIYSAIGIMLAFEKWIYITDSDAPQRPVDVTKDKIRPEYKVANRLINILPFKEENNALLDWISEVFTEKSDVELIKHCFDNPEKMVQIAKSMAKNEAKQKAKERQSIRDLIEAGDRKQKEIKADIGEMEVRPISEKALKKRQEKLEKEFSESLDNYVYVSRGLQFTINECNKEERMFLEEEYNGVCQICGEHILKYNSEPYFEAIKIIKASEAPEKLRESRKFGWDSLCLCPNCAARYKHSSKKISEIYKQVMSIEVEPNSDETININIELPEGEMKQIHYSPRHFLAMKEAFKIFAEIK